MMDIGLPATVVAGALSVVTGPYMLQLLADAGFVVIGLGTVINAV
jgi:hypothetical protein